MRSQSFTFRVARLVATFSIVLTLAVLAFSPAFVSSSAVAALPAQAGTPTPGVIHAVGFGGGVFNCDGWTVTVPKGVTSDGGYIHCGSFNPDKAPGSPSGYTLRRHTMNINIYDHNNEWVTFFGEPLTFCYKYGEADLTAAGGDVRKFTIITAPINGSWSVTLTTVDTNAGQACALVDHLTLFDLAILTGRPSTATSSAAVGGTPTPVSSGSPSATGSFISVTFRYGYKYTVLPGDNLFRIALRFRTTVVAIRAANNLDSNFIYVGQVLIVPTNFAFTPSTDAAPTTATPTSKGLTPTAKATTASTQTPSKQTVHVVQAGENLFRIAIRYNTTVADIQKANGLMSTTIFVGQQLIIPPAK